MVVEKVEKYGWSQLLMVDRREREEKEIKKYWIPYQSRMKYGTWYGMTEKRKEMNDRKR